ncbi:MAG: ATP-binding cassette domain-containing protein, partial [Kiritimatiellae bacterium]|nr:ATP-binding cassette domain-containing protein [Kiritimatiellia bacterium]
MLSVRNLTKRFGRVIAVNNISFEVGRNEIVGVLGPNGAGKTTTLRILSCFLPPTSGVVCMDGLDIFENSLEIRRRIGYLPENVPLYLDMRVTEYLRYRAQLKGLRGRRLRNRLMAVLDVCELKDCLLYTS